MQTNRVYHDWEFHDLGYVVNPLSVGLVCPEANKKYYAVFEDIDTITQAVQNPWLRANVFSSLPMKVERDVDYPDGSEAWCWLYDENHKDYGRLRTREEIRSEVTDFFEEISWSGDIELWGWYSGYDHFLLGSLFGKMMNFPSYLPMWTNDLRQEAHRLRVDPDEIPQQLEGVHNSLADADHMVNIHSYLKTIESR